MKRYGIAALILAVLSLLLLLLTRFGTHVLRSDTLVVQLGLEASESARAQALDESVLAMLERGHFDAELRQRLDRPAHVVQLEGFHADACEVRQIDFERFANWRRQIMNGGDSATASALNFAGGALYSSSSGHRIAGWLQSPASGVNYAGAAAYCDAAGGRLPWAEEWEALAVGRTGRAARLYPWGDTFSDAPWPYQDAHRNASQACGTHPAAATAAGAHDLASNAMEWSRGQRARRGYELQPGAHGAPAVRANGRALYALAAAWLQIPPETRSHHLGFRCVYARPPQLPLPWDATPRQVAVDAGEYQLGVPADLRLARIAVLLPANQQRTARSLIGTRNTRRLEVSRCEVRREEYQAFLRHPLARLGLFANEHEPRWQDYTPRNWQQQLEQPELPVSGINWWAADAYSRWAGGRLPRLEEWQLLAAGPSANQYPWGDDYQAGDAATGDQPQPGTHPCGTAARDRSAAGVQDLAGNVSEWTLSITAEHGDYAAWVQGGNWLIPGVVAARSVFGRLVPLNHRSESIGFRVVYD